MHMLNSHCGIDRDPRGVVRLTICNAGPLNILGSAVIQGCPRGIGDTGGGPDKSACWSSPAQAKKA